MPRDNGKWVESVHCGAPGCHKSTREGKPYCPRHVEAMPYVAHLVAIEEQRARELQAAAEGHVDKVDTSGPTAGEILRIVREKGRVSVDRLCRETNMRNKVAMHTYLTALRRAGRIRYGANKRGNQVVMLV